MATSALPIRATRPIISLNGERKPVLTNGLLSMLIEETTQGLYRCETVFGNWGAVNNTIGYLYFDRQTLDFGKTIKVQVGTDRIFEGRLMAIEGQFGEGRAPAINVLAEDRFQDLRMTRRTRTFENVTDSDVITQIAGEHGLTPSDDVTGPQYKVLAQVNQSDLSFLRDRARAIDAELWIEGSTLNAKSRQNRNSGTVQLTYGAGLREFSVLADLAGQRTSVIASGWDVSSKSVLTHEATDSIVSGELNGDQSGPSALRSAIGERRESIAHTIPLSSREVEARAEAYFKMAARRFVVGRGIAETGSKLRVGAFVDLRGLGPLFSGKYYL
jgi:hypothetical protein